MSEITLLIRVTIDDKQVDKFNVKRQRLGRQTRTAEEEVINHVDESLRHNLIFESVEITRYCEACQQTVCVDPSMEHTCHA